MPKYQGVGWCANPRCGRPVAESTKECPNCGATNFSLEVDRQLKRCPYCDGQGCRQCSHTGKKEYKLSVDSRTGRESTSTIDEQYRNDLGEVQQWRAEREAEKIGQVAGIIFFVIVLPILGYFFVKYALPFLIKVHRIATEAMDISLLVPTPSSHVLAKASHTSQPPVWEHQNSLKESASETAKPCSPDRHRPYSVQGYRGWPPQREMITLPLCRAGTTA
jgi:hypothetical protein